MVIELRNPEGTIELVDIEDNNGQDIEGDLMEDLAPYEEDFIPE